MRPDARTYLAILVAAMLLCGLGACSHSPEKPRPEAPSTPGAWPQLRGPGGLGVVPAADGDYPLDWDVETGRNILWKVDVPAFGHSSPIVWGDRVLLTGESDGKGRVVCLARSDGATLWDVAVQSAGPDFTSTAMGGGLCASTPATDGRCVYALFSTGDLACVSLDGELLWTQHLCDPVNSFGLSSSPILWKDIVIVQLDQGNSPDDGLSVIVAVDTRTRQVRWSTKRAVPNSWSTPIVIRHAGRDELITCANPLVMAYDPDTGAELWRAGGLGGEVVPMPAFGGGRVFVANAESKAMAIVPGGAGDVTETRVAWTAEDGLPPMASPLTDGRLLLLCGLAELTCYDAATGRRLWQQAAGEGFWASPTLVGRRVYLPDRNGATFIFELADRYELAACPQVGDEVTATPAFADGRIYLRTKGSLLCIGQP